MFFFFSPHFSWGRYSSCAPVVIVAPLIFIRARLPGPEYTNAHYKTRITMSFSRITIIRTGKIFLFFSSRGNGSAFRFYGDVLSSLIVTRSRVIHGAALAKYRRWRFYLYGREACGEREKKNNSKDQNRRRRRRHRRPWSQNCYRSHKIITNISGRRRLTLNFITYDYYR